MALPTSDNTVNVTRLGSILSTLWGKIKTKFGTKADKVSNATSGHLASLDSYGDLVDSGKSISDMQQFIVNLSETNNVVTADKTLVEIATAYNNNQPVLFSYGEYLCPLLACWEYTDEDDPTIHYYQIVTLLQITTTSISFVGKNFDGSPSPANIIPDTWTMEANYMADEVHRHGNGSTTGITSSGTMPGTIDSTKVLRGDGTWDAIHMHTINVSAGKFIRIRIPANTTVGNSSILFMRAYNKNSAYFCVNFAKYEDTTAFAQLPTVNVLLSNNHGNPDYIPQPGTNSSGDYRSCYTVNTNGDAYIFLYCSASYIGNYIINSNTNANLISVDIVSNTSSADSTLTPTLQGPANVRVNTYHTNETLTPLAGHPYNPIYVDSGGQTVATNIFTGYSDLATTEMLHFKLPNTTNYGSITFHSSVGTYALEYKVAFATVSGVFTVVPTITTCHHCVNNTNTKPIIYYNGSGTDLYFGFTGGNVKRIRWDAQMQNMGSMTYTKINRSDAPSGLSSNIPYDSPRPQLGTYTNWSDGTTTYIGRLAAIKYSTASGNYVNLTGTVLFQQYSNQCSGHWQLRVNATNGSFVLGVVYGTNIPTGFSLCAGIATYSGDSSPWRGEIYIYGKLTGLAYSAVSITIDQAVEGTAAPQNLYTEFYSNLSDSLTNTNVELQNRNLPYSTNATVGGRFEPVYVNNGVVTGSSQYFRSVTVSSNFSLMSSPYNTSSVPTGAIVFVTNTGSNAINVTYKSGTTVPVNANNTRVFGKISNTLWAFGQT